MNKPKVFPALFLLVSTAFQAFASSPQEGSGETGNYRLVWQDLFDAENLDPLRWEIEVNGGGSGNAELQYYTDRPENVRVGKDTDGNGCLILTARREFFSGRNFTSGRIISKNRIAFKHGKLEASIKLPSTANGLWPAFWMMGNDFDMVGWPKCGETDILEMGNAEGIANGTQDRFFNGAMHWGQGWPNASYAKSSTKSYSLQDGEFHLFTVIWDEDAVEMYVDLDKYPLQVPYFKMTIPENDPGNEWSPGNYFHKENFILFNLAVGGNFPGIHDPREITALNDANGNEASMLVNYVKLYQKGDDSESLFSLKPGDMPSGVEDHFASHSIGNIRFCGDSIVSDRNCSFSVTDLNGIRVMTGYGSELAVNTLGKGIYVVSAMDDDGNTSTLKILRH